MLPFTGSFVERDGVCRFPFYDEKKGLTLEEHPTTKMLALAFLVLIGLLLIAVSAGAALSQVLRYDPLSILTSRD